MPPLTLTIRFPTGQYHAHDARGNAEWPPAPARVATSLLATAYTTKNAAGVDVARALFDLQPPTIWTPSVGERHTGFARWVPVDVNVNLAAGTAERGMGSKLAKPPERGITIGEGQATVTWEDHGLSAQELSVLDDLLKDVTYLGRPTSAVIMDRAPDGSSDETPAGLTSWVPDQSGTERLRVATPQLLAALDARERQRERIGVTGYHPRLAARPEARYRPLETSQDRESGVRLATFAQTAEAIASLMYYGTPEAAPGDVAEFLWALDLPEGAFVVPVYGETSRKGFATPRLFGVATHAVPPQAPVYVRGRELVDSPRPIPGVSGATAERAIASAWGSSTAWSTLVPVASDRATLIQHTKDLAHRHGVELIDAVVHDACRHPHGPDTSLHPSRTHLSILVTQPISGPLIVQGAALEPLDAN